MSIELVHVYRGNQIESIHRGDIVAIDQNKEIIFEYGNMYKRTFWRSSAKPFQIIPFIEAGGLEMYNITQEELALMTASHGGEAKHLEVLEKLLKKLGKSINDLDCGSSRPMYEGEYKRLLMANIPFSPGNNPCSGKHAGMLGLGLIKAYDLHNYIDEEHVIQKIMLKIICEMTELHEEDIDIAIDGCGVPVFSLSIYNMAMAFSKLAHNENLDTHYSSQLTPKRSNTLKSIASAMTSAPYYVAGTSRLDTILMEETNGKVLAKLGAESVYCMTIMDQGIGIAMKTEDGAYRALDSIIPELLLKHTFISDVEFENINKRLDLNVYNHRTQVVGSMKSCI